MMMTQWDLIMFHETLISRIKLLERNILNDVHAQKMGVFHATISFCIKINKTQPGDPFLNRLVIPVDKTEYLASILKVIFE